MGQYTGLTLDMAVATD